jgi:hypothetical protein
MCINCEVEISMRPRLVPDKRIDAPPTSNPDRAADFLKADEYREHLPDIHRTSVFEIDQLITK